MSIKSLIFGSTDAMVIVSGAQAADAVVVEAEPAEFVRACDAYGSDFSFIPDTFIPDTEKAIRLNGFIRSLNIRLMQKLFGLTVCPKYYLGINLP